MALITYDPTDGTPLIPYAPAENALYRMVETFEQDGMTLAQWAAVNELRNAILRYDADDDEEFSESWGYNYSTDRYTFKPEKEFNVTVITRATMTVTARTTSQAARLAEEAFDNKGMDAVDEIFDVEYTDVFER